MVRIFLDSVSIEDLNLGIEQGFYFIYENTPASLLGSAQFIVSGQTTTGESISGIYTHPKELGVVDNSKGYEQLVIAEPIISQDAEGFFVEDLAFVTPVEAESMCVSHGLSLGELHVYKSQEMIDFQTRHLVYGSQVGLEELSQAFVAVNVPTTYDPS